MGETVGGYDSAEQLSRRLETHRAHPARVYDVFLGGKDNYPADREAAKAGLESNPRGYCDVRHNRDFVRRAVSFLVEEAGIRQFLDIGTGLPTQQNVHQIAQGIAPTSRVVYVDNDPVVLMHARALLTSGPEGMTDYVDADLHDSGRILAAAAETLDFEQPVALVLAAILHFVEDDAAHDVVARLLNALPSGSYLVLSHLSADMNPERITEVARTFQERGFTWVLRPASELTRMVTVNQLREVDPGLTPVHRWRPSCFARSEEMIGASETSSEDPEQLAGMELVDRMNLLGIDDVTDEDINIYGVVAYKP
ncbi:SAM-dependent methyltransferase [Streptomyces oceani]|uniref:SAM-dependent methyltransferase n=1 Tax=Streptomyces oceani TaxID=1075402 RepID=A0A1E7JXF3_9ACTN|nr:SAM-dependent methyltransferase [Streptomyces oceani]OEU96351.1 hypothetical protein AN216_21065 [Streptomyces oceani]